MTSPVRNSRVAGFTLLELVLVTAALVILIATAVPNIQHGWAALQTERTAFTVAQTLRSARTLAIASSASVAWVWDAEARQVCLGGPTARRCATDHLGDRLASPRRIPEPIQMTATRQDQPVAQVTFFPDGTSQPTTFLISSPGASRYRITVDATTSQVAVQLDAAADAHS